MSAAEVLTRTPAAAAIAGNHVIPPGRQIPVEQMPAGGYLEVFRYAELPEWEQVIPEIGPVGHVILYALPGAGKTRLALQMAHCVAYLRPVAGYKPDEPGRVWYADFENQAEGLTRASLQLDPFGSIDTDTIGIDDAAERQLVRVLDPFKGETFDERLVELTDLLAAADTGGELPRLLVVDTLQQFCFPYPDTNSQRWEKRCSLMLDALALKYRVCLLSVHHANKAGELSGSTGLAGGATAIFKLLREGGTTEGRLICDGKNRAGRDTLCLRGAFVDGRWDFTDEVTAGQVATGHTQRRILDWLYGSGPAAVEAIRAGLPDVKAKTVSDLLSRLRAKGYVVRDVEGRWACASRKDHAAMMRACVVCGRPMTVTEPGQTTHPNCDPAPARPPLRDFGPGVPGDYWLDKPAAVEDRGRLAEVVPLPRASAEPATDPAAVEDDQGDDDGSGPCGVCGIMRTPEDPHPACVPSPPGAPKWPGMRILADSLRASKLRPRPVSWIAPEGDERGRGDGRQHRGMPQWQAAAEASTCEHRWQLPGLLDTYGPDRLVVAFDRGQSYPAAASSVPLALGLLLPHGPIDRNPKELGPASDRHKAGVTGLAGIAVVVVPQWDHAGIGHPLGARARPGELMTISTASLEGLWNLHGRGLIDAPQVVESWLGVRSQSILEPFANEVRAARDKYRDDPVMTAAVKLGSSIALRTLHPVAASSPHWRPDWRAGMAAEAAFRHFVVAWNAVEAGEVCCSLGVVDQACYLLPEGADPETWTPHGYKPGRDWGMVKRVAVEVRASCPGLARIDPARISPAGHARHVSVSGPLPLDVWVMHRA